MGKYGLVRCVARLATYPPLPPAGNRFYSRTTLKPLRILFCGSDAFSCASLVALHNEHQRDRGGIASIDVVCRPGKPSGRSMKAIREVPLKSTAQELGLTVHEIDTFTGWDLPIPCDESINLIIAVSFGLFVPPRILKAAEYGGLNVHPSLLPNYRGPAPLHHIILHGEKYTGVTLQTLDHKSFDHGTILDQTASGELKIEEHQKIKYSDLLELVTPMSAEMLVRGIRKRIFMPPLPQLDLPPPPQTLIHAHKIQTKDKEIDWMNHDAVAIERRFRALGSLWNNIYQHDNTTVRVKFEDIRLIRKPSIFEEWHARALRNDAKQSGDLGERRKEVDEGILSQIRFMAYQTQGGQSVPLPYVQDGDAIIVAPQKPEKMALRIARIIAAGMGVQPASKVAERLRVDQACPEQN